MKKNAKGKIVKKHSMAAGAVGIAGVILITSCGENDESNGSQTEGVAIAPEFHVAEGTQPPSLDPLMGTSPGPQTYGALMYEPLVALDSNSEAQPVLAESFEMNDDNTVLTFILREDVPFHNGDIMTEDDVIASLERWRDMADIGQLYFSDAEFESPEEGVVTVTLNNPLALAPLMMAEATRMPFIMPAQVIEEAGDGGIEEHIGTGPYKFGEWEIDSYWRYERFEDYVSPEGEASGLAGERQAHFEEFYVHYVGDGSTRLNGLITGEYDLATAVPYDNYQQIEDDANNTLIAEQSGVTFGAFNKRQGPLTDQTLRQAIIAAVDTEGALLATYATPDHFDDNSGLVPRTSPFFVEPDEEIDALHREQNLDEAQRLLDESDYDGELIRIIAASENVEHYNLAVMLHENMMEAGINSELVTSDWATVVETREDPEAYEIHVGGVSRSPLLPPTLLYLNPTWPGWAEDEDLQAAGDRFLLAEEEADVMAAMEDLQDAYYDYAPIVKFGDRFHLFAMNNEFEGFGWNSEVGPIFNNIRPVQ